MGTIARVSLAMAVALALLVPLVWTHRVEVALSIIEFASGSPAAVPG